MNTGWWNGVWAAVAMGATLLLAGCDAGPSAVDARSAGSDRIERRSAAADDAVAYADREPDGGDRGERASRRTEKAPSFEGRPLWSSNRRYPAEENARRHFERNGHDVGAKSYEDFVRKVHAFTGSPPKGAQTLTRANGDILIYDARTNLFAVVTRDGAPRTMFKPDDGPAYWDKQKAREAEGGRSRQPRDSDA